MRDRKRLFSQIWDMPYGRTYPFALFDSAKNSREFVQKLQLQIKIPVHNGCVNSICWNDNGKYLLSGSDDQRLSVVHGYNYSVLAYIQTGHRANIFSAKFLPNSGDSHVVSCSGDGIIIYSNLDRPETSLMNKFNCHRGTAYEIMTVPNDPNTFLSCGEDRTVRWFDIRTKTSCSIEDCKEDILINCRSPVTSLAVNPLTPFQLAVGCADASVQIFDRRMLSTQATSGTYPNNGHQALMTRFTVPEFTQSRRITSLCYSTDGLEMLVSYSSDYIYLFDIRDDLDKKPRLLSRNASSNNADGDSGFSFRGPPLMKRLRVRGDWSDTGPNARPEAELREAQETTTQASIVRRMTDILTRMFNSSTQNRRRTATSSSESSRASSHSEEGDVENVSDSNEDNDGHNTESKVAKNQSKSQALQAHGEGSSSKPDSSSDNKSSCDLPSTSNSALDQGNKSNDSLDSVPQPSTSGMHSEYRSDNVVSESSSNEKHSGANETLPESVNLSYQNVEGKLEARRNELVEKHNSEPMMNLHYSGQSVSSGVITMDVPSSSTTNERQWLEQNSSDAADAPAPQTEPQATNSESAEVNNNHAESSESDTDAAVQTVEPRIRIANVQSLTSEPTQLPTNPETDEVELMMEVDSWDADSDDEAQPQPSRSGRSNRRLRDTYLRSFSGYPDVGDDKNEDGNKEECGTNFSQPRVKRKYTGHRNARTMIKESTFWGDNFIMSGSDCGHIFIWDRHTAELVMLMEADHHVVNCLQPHPFDPILATSGIDYDIKLWAPLREEPFFDQDKANEIIKRNEIMLEETKDTITVPASFMFRMLATLNHFRTGRALRWSVAREMRNANSDSR